MSQSVSHHNVLA